MTEKATAGAGRSSRVVIALSPDVHGRIKAAAKEMGVSTSAWAALRLAEAVRAQERVGAALDSMGVEVGRMLMEEARKDDEKPT